MNTFDKTVELLQKHRRDLILQRTLDFVMGFCLVGILLLGAYGLYATGVMQWPTT